MRKISKMKIWSLIESTQTTASVFFAHSSMELSRDSNNGTLITSILNFNVSQNHPPLVYEYLSVQLSILFLSFWQPFLRIPVDATMLEYRIVLNVNLSNIVVFSICIHFPRKRSSKILKTCARSFLLNMIQFFNFLSE